MLAALMPQCGVAAESTAARLDDIEKYALLRETRIDVSGPEPAGFTALGVAPFVTAQALASSDLAFSAAQIIDDRGNPRAAIGVDFTPWALAKAAELRLGDYQRDRINRFISRIQVSLAASKGESADDHSTRISPTFRFVLHELRDPRVHRGPGSLRDCLAREAALPDEDSAALAEIAARLAALANVTADAGAGAAAEAAAEQERETLEVRRRAIEAKRITALQAAVRAAMAVCRDDPEVAAYTWNATGYALGLSPALLAPDHGFDSLKLKGFVGWFTAAYGFDPQGTLPGYVPSLLGSHAQVLGQVMYRRNELVPDLKRAGTLSDVDELTVSTRLRGGTSPWNGNIEGAMIHDWFENGSRDTYYKLTGGTDIHLFKGTWLSFSVGRTFWRGVLPNETSIRASLKWAVLE